MQSVLKSLFIDHYYGRWVLSFPLLLPAGGALSLMNKQLCFAECRTGSNTDLDLSRIGFYVLPCGSVTMIYMK